MFHSAQTLAPLEAAKLERLRLSLNSPVVAVESLPVGPAAAGIAVHRAPGGARITIAVRSVRSGQLLFFHPDDTWSERESEGLALEAALSFAESMGFLFDEDPVERGADPAEAATLWDDFLERGEVTGLGDLLERGEAVPAEAPADAAEPALEQGPDEPEPALEVLPGEPEPALEWVADAAEPALEWVPDEPEPALEAAKGALDAPTDAPAAALTPEACVEDAAVVPCDPPVPSELVLSKFRFLSSIPTERLLSPPAMEESVHNDSVLRLLSRF
ncbi:MAG: hypothetical protein QNK04_12480 [Myxococcota bacterium]|nr:hypothetical protein [Myxococcota bacterium]